MGKDRPILPSKHGVPDDALHASISKSGITALLKWIADIDVPQSVEQRQEKAKYLSRVIFKASTDIIESFRKENVNESVPAETLLPLIISVISLADNRFLLKANNKLQIITEEANNTEEAEAEYYRTNFAIALSFVVMNPSDMKVVTSKEDQKLDIVIRSSMGKITKNLDTFMGNNQSEIMEVDNYESNLETLKWLKECIDQLKSEYKTSISKKKLHQDVVKDLSTEIDKIYYQDKQTPSLKIKKMVALIWARYDAKRNPYDVYKKLGVFGGSKSTESLEAHLNDEQTGHHSTRKLGLILKECDNDLVKEICCDSGGVPDLRFMSLQNPYEKFPPQRESLTPKNHD